jgi:hypothetical protein
MKKIKNFLGTTAILMAVSSQAIAAQAVHFRGDTRLYNPGTVIAPITTTSVVCSYWIDTANLGPAVIVDSSVQNLAASLLIVHQGVMGDGSANGLLLNVSMNGADARWQVVSKDAIPTNGTWQHIAFAADTVGQRFKWSLQGREKQIDPDLTYMVGQPGFGMVFGNNRWSIGGANQSRARLPPFFFGAAGEYFGSSMGKYNGDLAELVCYFGTGGYDDITNAHRTQSGFPKANFAREFVNGLNQRVLFGPDNLGPGCVAVFFAQPTLCMRGAPEFFRRNQILQGNQTAFIEIEGSLQDALSDPFSLWGPGGPP